MKVRYVVILGFAIFATIASVALWLGGPVGTTQTGSQLFVFTGEGNSVTTPFEVPNAWELRWEFPEETNMKSVAWIDAEGERTYISSEPQKPLRAHGSVNNFEGGVYTAQVRANGPWTLRVFSLLEK